MKIMSIYWLARSFRIPSYDCVALAKYETKNKADRIQDHAQKSDDDGPKRSEEAQLVNVAVLVWEQSELFLFVVSEPFEEFQCTFCLIVCLPSDTQKSEHSFVREVDDWRRWRWWWNENWCRHSSARNLKFRNFFVSSRNPRLTSLTSQFIFASRYWDWSFSPSSMESSKKQSTPRETIWQGTNDVAPEAEALFVLVRLFSSALSNKLSIKCCPPAKTSLRRHFSITSANKLLTLFSRLGVEFSAFFLYARIVCKASVLWLWSEEGNSVRSPALIEYIKRWLGALRSQLASNTQLG